MNSQPQHLPSPEKTLRGEKKEKKKQKIDSLQFPLMNVEFPISILITQARLSAVLKITTNSTASFHINSEKENWPLPLKHSHSSLVHLPPCKLLDQVLNESFHSYLWHYFGYMFQETQSSIFITICHWARVYKHLG